MKTSANFEADLIKALRQIEEACPVDQLVNDDMYLWPMLKVKIYFDNWGAYNSGQNTAPTVSFKTRLIEAVKFGLQFIIQDFSNMTFPQKCDVLFFADPFNRRVIVDDKKFEIYLDPIVNQARMSKLKTLVVERNAVGRYQSPRFSRSIPQFILQIFFSPLLFRKLNLSSEFCAALESVRGELEKYGLSTAAIDDRRVQRYVSIFQLHYAMYLRLLKWCQPKFVVLTEWYSIVSMSLILACKKSGIQSFDVQHGVQSEAHIAYGNFVKLVGQNVRTPFPDFFWVWTPADFQNIEKNFSIYKSKGFLGGHLFMNQVASSELSLKGEDLLAPLVQKAQNLRKEICVVTLQPTYELHPLILNFIDQQKSRYFFMIRLHPIMIAQIESYRKKLADRFSDLDFDIDFSSSQPLVTLLKFAKLHITFNSSTVLEAESFNVPSLVFDHDLAREYFKAQIESGICKVYSRDDQVLEFENLKNHSQVIQFQKLGELM